jgi:hypothetical protein
MIVAAALLVVGSSLIQAGTARAQAADPNHIDALACTPSAGGWTDCSIVLNQAIPAGGSVVASLNGGSATVAFCSDGTPFNSLCGAYGNEAVFYCPTGCAPGKQFDVSAIGTSPTALSQSLNVALGATDINWPGPEGFVQPNTPSDPGNDTGMGDN